MVNGSYLWSWRAHERVASITSFTRLRLRYTPLSMNRVCKLLKFNATIDRFMVPMRARFLGWKLPMNLPNRSHPERSEGSFATGTQSKDPVSFTMDIPRDFHGIPSTPLRPPFRLRSAQDDCDFGGSSRTKKHARVLRPSE